MPDFSLTNDALDPKILFTDSSNAIITGNLTRLTSTTVQDFIYNFPNDFADGSYTISINESTYGVSYNPAENLTYTLVVIK